MLRKINFAADNLKEKKGEFWRLLITFRELSKTRGRGVSILGQVRSPSRKKT